MPMYIPEVQYHKSHVCVRVPCGRRRMALGATPSTILERTPLVPERVPPRAADVPCGMASAW